jgi:hypothetical protein
MSMLCRPNSETVSVAKKCDAVRLVSLFFVFVTQSTETPLARIGPAHFSISVSTNFCR